MQWHSSGVMLALFVSILVVATVVAYSVTLRLRGRSRSRLAEYGFQIRDFHLSDDGDVQYAQWLHPKESPKTIQQEQVDAIRQFVQPGDLVIDIGAHTGDTTVPLALAAGKEGLTLGLEPNPFVYKVLQQNAQLNADKTHIIPLNFAATDSDGTYTFHYSDGGYCNGGLLSNLRDQTHRHRQPLDVQGRDLDAFLRQHYEDRLDRLSYIKIDTEGYDAYVLRSLAGIIAECRPVIVCEVLKRLVCEEREELYDVLDRASYACYKTQSHQPRCGMPIGRQDMMAWKHFDILAIPKRVGSAAA